MENAWRQSREKAGGGALIDMGMHCIDLMQYVTGSPVREVAAFNDTLTFRYPVEDSSIALLRLENGAQCVVQSNFNIRTPPQGSAGVLGTRGRLLGDGVLCQTRRAV